MRPRPEQGLLRQHQLGGHQRGAAPDGAGADHPGLQDEETEAGNY